MILDDKPLLQCTKGVSDKKIIDLQSLVFLIHSEVVALVLVHLNGLFVGSAKLALLGA